jgi:exodeoxyribonuclease VII large subunit
LQHQSPVLRLERVKHQAHNLTERLQRLFVQGLQQRRGRLQQLARDLHTLSPLNTLERGYAIVSRAADDRILRDAGEIRPGQRTKVRLARGRLLCEVIETNRD